MEAIPRKETPTLGVDRVLLESKNVYVVTSGHLKIANRQYTSGIHNLSHDLCAAQRNASRALLSSSAFTDGPNNCSKKPSFTSRSTIVLSMTLRKSKPFICAAICGSAC